MKNTWLENTMRVLLFTLTPFIISLGIWTLLAYSHVISGIEREREIGIQHNITEQQMWFESLRIGADQSWPYAIAGFGAGTIGGSRISTFSRKTTTVVIQSALKIGRCTDMDNVRTYASKLGSKSKVVGGPNYDLA